MNEQTVKLIEELSVKLGVGAEMLWDSLLKQAPISATIDLIFSAIFVAASVAIFLAIVRFRKSWRIYENTESFPFMAIMALLGLLFVIFTTVAVGCSLQTNIAAFVNPEYWALKQLIP